MIIKINIDESSWWAPNLHHLERSIYWIDGDLPVKRIICRNRYDYYDYYYYNGADTNNGRIALINGKLSWLRASHEWVADTIV